MTAREPATIAEARDMGFEIRSLKADRKAGVRSKLGHKKALSKRMGATTPPHLECGPSSEGQRCAETDCIDGVKRIFYCHDGQCYDVYCDMPCATAEVAPPKEMSSGRSEEVARDGEGRRIGMVDHSQMRLGKRHARHDPRIPLLARYVGTALLPAPAPAVDWYSKVEEWGMMLNDTIGDCTCAAVGHIILQWSTYTGNAERPADVDILHLYEAVSGYDPQHADTDQGAVEVDVLNYWMNNAALNHALTAYASIEVGNIAEIKDAISWFGNVYVGLQLPLSAQQQTVWAVPPGGAVREGAPGSWGGHAVPVVGYDSRGLYCVTWGAIKRMSYEFWASYCDEAYALLSKDFINTNNMTPAGISWDDLEADMAAIKRGFQSIKMIRRT